MNADASCTSRAGTAPASAKSTAWTSIRTAKTRTSGSAKRPGVEDEEDTGLLGLCPPGVSAEARAREEVEEAEAPEEAV